VRCEADCLADWCSSQRLGKGKSLGLRGGQLTCILRRESSAKAGGSFWAR
jgi:hypothetical protein